MPQQSQDREFDWFERCPLCDGSYLQAWEASAAGYSIHPLRVRCGGCGLVFSNPQASEARLEHYYQNVYFSQGGMKAGYFDEASSQWLLNKAAEDLKHLEAGLPGRGRLLDVGAAAGYFLVQARKRGWAVEGVELSAQAARRARRQGLKIHVKRLEDLKLRRRFDAVACFHTLEHVKDPVGFCRRLGSLTGPRGRILIEVPNRRALWPLLWHYGAVLRGRTAPLDHAKEHTFDFSAGTLRRTLERAGLRVLSLRCVEDPGGPLRLASKPGESPLKAAARSAFVRAARLSGAERWWGTYLQALAAPR